MCCNNPSGPHEKPNARAMAGEIHAIMYDENAIKVNNI